MWRGCSPWPEGPERAARPAGGKPDLGAPPDGAAPRAQETDPFGRRTGHPDRSHDGPSVSGIDNAHSCGLPAVEKAMPVLGTQAAVRRILMAGITTGLGIDIETRRSGRSIHRDALRGRNRPGEGAGQGVRTRRAGGATKSSKGRAASRPVAGQSGGSGPAHARRPEPGADADGCGAFAPTVHPGTGDTVLVGGWLMEQGRWLLARHRDTATP